MEYVVVKLNPPQKQISIEDLFSLTDEEFESKYSIYESANYTSTRTYEVDEVSKKFMDRINVSPMYLIRRLETFNKKYESLFEQDRENLYRTFHIPKKKGGLRRIDAPNEELKNALRELKLIFENDFHALYHTSAFAYVKNRSTIDAVRKHQENKSRWFAKFDLSNFFGSTTEDYVMKMLGMIFPFSYVIKSGGAEALRKAISLAFLNGGLPQGTPISPLITNIIMIPVDFRLSNKFRNFDKHKLIYTRYADDFIISCEYDFEYKKVEDELINCLAEFGAPFSINKDKTRYGSSAGSNWNLGIMLNKDNQMTVGYKNKRKFAAMVFTYAMDRINGTHWDLNDMQVMEGYRNYYRMIEKETIDNIIHKVNVKLNINVVDMIKEDIAGGV